MKNFYKGLILVGSLALASCGQSSGVGTSGSGPGAGDSGVPCNPCRIFSSATQTNGVISSIAAIDAVCNADANKPNTSTYKALLWYSGSREAPSTDWPLKEGVSYVRADGVTAVSTGTSDGSFVLPLTNSIDATSNNYHWTGIDISNYPMLGEHANSCNGWTSSSNSDGGVTGTSSLSASGLVIGMASGSSGRDCDLLLRVYCVEQ